MNSAKEAWLSLYTNELQRIWQSEQGALRKPAMLHYILRRELQNLQENLDDDIQLFKRQILSPKERKSSKRRASDDMGLNENELSGSPTIAKRRNFTSTRHIPKLKLSEKENLDVDIVDSATEVNKLSTSTGVSNADMMAKLQSLIENIPGNSSIKKGRRIFNFKSAYNNKTIIPVNLDSESEDVVIDLTFCDDEMETSTNLKDIKNTLEEFDKSKSPLVIHETEPVRSTVDCTDEMETSTTLKDIENTLEEFDKSKSPLVIHEMEPVRSTVDCTDEMETSTTLKDITNTLEDYDKHKSPLFVHKTESVRSTADCTELPGWSCEDCKMVYESSNMELFCSKHGNKIDTLNEINGVLDIATFLTKDEHN